MGCESMKSDIECCEEYLFSIVMAVYNSESYLTESISSVINQSINFTKNIQLILVDDGSTDDSKNILLNYQRLYPNNIVVLSQENQGRANARNLGLQHVKGKYVNFLESDDILSDNTLEEVYSFFKKNTGINIVSIPRFLFERINGHEKLNYMYYSDRVIDLTKEPNNPLMSVSSVFIDSSLIKDNNYSFDSMDYSDDSLFINELLLKELKFGVINNVKYFYRQRLTLNGIHDTISFSDYYYCDRFKEFHEKIISECIELNGEVPDFIQFSLLYDLKCLFIKSHLNLSSFENHSKFFINIHNILQHIDIQNIEDNLLLDNNFKKLFLILKNKNYKSKFNDFRSLIESVSDEKLLWDIVKVSIIIPVYNVEKYLEECLWSVVTQSLKEIEIICINDGSTDDSLRILNDFAKNDSRIRIISKENGGQAIARNIGINEAIGDYIGFVDSDDFIKSNMFEIMYGNVCDGNLDINMCKVSSFDDLDNTVNSSDWYYSLKCFDGFEKKIFNHLDTKEFTDEISVTPYNKLYKRDFIIKNKLYFPENLIFEDEAFFYDVYLKAERISIVDENLYSYRVNREGSTVSRDADNDYTDILRVFQKIREILKKYNLMDIYKKQVYNKFFHKCLARYSETSTNYRPNFWKMMKNDFESIIDFDFDVVDDSLSVDVVDDKISINDLELRVKDRIISLCTSEDYDEFRLKDTNKLFTIIMAVYNTEDYLDESISSVINQSIGFVHNVQLILVDDGSTDNSKNILLNYQELYPDNIIVLSKENGGQASARNLGLEYAKGKYVNFLDSDDYFSYHTLKEVYEFFMKYGDQVDVVSLPLIQFGRTNAPHALNYKFYETRVINLENNPNNPQLHISSSFIKRESLSGLKFPTTFMGSEDGHVILKVLLKKKAYGVLSSSKYFYRKREDFSSTLDEMVVNFNHYTPRLKFHFMELINYSIKNYGEVPLFLQYSLIYDLQWILNTPPNEIFKNDLEIEEFSLYLKNILSFIENHVILENFNIQNDILKKYLYTFKNNKVMICTDDNVILKSAELELDKLNIHKIWLDIVEIKEGSLVISGLFNSLFNRENISIIAVKKINNDSERFVGKYVKYTSRQDISFLPEIWQFNSNFDLNIPLYKNEKSTIELFVCYHKDGNTFNYDEENILKFKLPIGFNKFCSIAEDTNYIVSENNILLFKDNTFNISPFSFRNMVTLERGILKKFKNSNEEKFTDAFKLRQKYLISYPFVRLLKKFKSIYLFSDRIEMAGDNAEALFNYAIKQKDSNLKFFVIGKDSPDYLRLKGKKNVIVFNSLKHKLLYLFADKVISSHPDDEIFDPFFDNYKLYSNLVSSKKYFLQHGVTKDDISTWLRKFDKNISLITAVSKIEQDSFFDSENGYDDEIVSVLGFPRYDKLNNESTKKQILIMPTWVNRNMDENQFKSTEYFNRLYELLHDEQLVKLCNKYGYEIVFRPHPKLCDYLELFEVPNYIHVELDKSYAQLFNESALLITDYSSVAFDFAYLKKPVIYYQYYKYYNFDLDKSYFKYDKMGFGDVIRDKESLLKKINQYLANHCTMENKFIDRVTNFFEYDDDNNCKRNYDWINDH